MKTYTAAIVGCGRIGAGYNWIITPYSYTHADTYKFCKRTDLVAVCDPMPDRLKAAQDKYHVNGYKDYREMLDRVKPDIVSVCTGPATRTEILQAVGATCKGCWTEKPYAIKGFPQGAIPTQVNYIRRFDARHQTVSHKVWKETKLHVVGKLDVHTVCHFTDLARYWKICRGNLIYHTYDGPCNYWLDFGGKDSEFFYLGGVSGGFMENALANLLDTIEGKAELVSPPESAILSEEWADELIGKEA